MELIGNPIISTAITAFRTCGLAVSIAGPVNFGNESLGGEIHFIDKSL